MSQGHATGWLGGVCAEIAHRLNFSALGVRVVTVIAALMWPLLTVSGYLLATYALRHFKPTPSDDPYLRDWDRRLDEFDRRFGP